MVIDEKAKQTIKGILGSFTFIDLDFAVGERAFRVQWRDSVGRKNI